MDFKDVGYDNDAFIKTAPIFITVKRNGVIVKGTGVMK